MGKRELIALLNLSSWCLVMVERLFLAVPRGCLQFVIVVFPDHTHLLFFIFLLMISSPPFILLFYFHFINNKQTLKLFIFYQRTQPNYLLKQCQIIIIRSKTKSKYILPCHFWRPESVIRFFLHLLLHSNVLQTIFI